MKYGSTFTVFMSTNEAVYKPNGMPKQFLDVALVVRLEEANIIDNVNYLAIECFFCTN